jgi:membrane fusion protein, copper/silver efflux system
MKLVPVRANVTAAAAPVAGPRTIKYYKSSMNPGEVSPKPGKDSMGMDMIPVFEDAAPAASPTIIQIDAGTIQRMNLRTDLVTRGPVRREFRTVGTLAFNEQGLWDVTTKFDGWLEKVFVNSTWAAVKAGDPLFEIYSPDLYNAQLNYLVALRSEGAGGGAEGGGPLTRASLARLRLFDVPADFLAEIARTGEPKRTLVFRAPANGVVIEKMAVAGQMMKAGEKIYRLADLSTVWALAQVYENDLPFVRAGQDATVRLTYGPTRELAGKVDLVLPQIEEQTRSATARIVLPNADGALRPGMFVEVGFSAQLADSAVLVPEMAVLRSGERNTVFIARDDGSFEPREVTLGARNADGRYEVLAGLAAGERVVTSGQFMLDSESQLREAIQKMLGAADGAPKPTAEATPVSSRPSQNSRPEAGVTPHDALTSLALATADAAAALADDDIVGYQKLLPELRADLAAAVKDAGAAERETLARAADSLPDRSDLKPARRDFAVFSTIVTDVARAHHLQHTEKLSVYECPMAPVVGKGRWLQRGGGLRNPFFGSTMLTCGEELK